MGVRAAARHWCQGIRVLYVSALYKKRNNMLRFLRGPERIRTAVQAFAELFRPIPGGHRT